MIILKALKKVVRLSLIVSLFFLINLSVLHASETSENAVTFIELGSKKCIPCKMMQPVMDAIAKDYAEKVKVVFHDVWTKEGAPIGKKYGIKGIPTQIFLDKKGKEFYRHTGFLPAKQIEELLKKHGIEK